MSGPRTQPGTAQALGHPGAAGAATRSGRRLMPAVSTWAFFLTFCGQGVRDLVGWTAFGVLAAISGIALYTVFRQEGHRVRWDCLPRGASLFVIWCVLSTAWSANPGYTFLAALLSVATTACGVLIAMGLSLRDWIDALSRALEASLVLSLLLELFVAIFVRHPIAPLYMRGWKSVPPSYMWSYGHILQGGPIQGIVGNRNPMCFIALLALVCVWVRWRSKRISRTSVIVWSATSLLVLVLTRSATVLIAAVLCCGALGVLEVVRRTPPAKRRLVERLSLALTLAGIAFVVVFRDWVAGLMHRSPDLTGRLEIWRAVIRLWSERPALGWGWTMYWIPWLPQYKDLVIRPDGTPTMSSHNAYLEALLQTGVLGAVLIIGVVLVLTYRTWRLALQNIDGEAATWLPAILFTAMLVQSFTESRLLSEGNWVLVVAVGTWLRLHQRYLAERASADHDGAAGGAPADRTAV